MWLPVSSEKGNFLHWTFFHLCWWLEAKFQALLHTSVFHLVRTLNTVIHPPTAAFPLLGSIQYAHPNPGSCPPITCLTGTQSPLLPPSQDLVCWILYSQRGLTCFQEDGDRVFMDILHKALEWILEPSEKKKKRQLTTTSAIRGTGTFAASYTRGWASRWLSGRESACQAGDVEFNPWVGKIPTRREMATYSNILAWKMPWTEPGGLHALHQGVANSRADSATKQQN